jgi:hypothetical protein
MKGGFLLKKKPFEGIASGGKNSDFSITARQ